MLTPHLKALDAIRDRAEQIADWEQKSIAFWEELGESVRRQNDLLLDRLGFEAEIARLEGDPDRIKERERELWIEQRINDLLSLRTDLKTDTAKAGQWFSLIMGGRRYVHQVAEDKTAASGVMVGLKINPMLRRSPADNTVAEFAQPKVEGFLSGRETTWTVDVARTVGLSFTITERE